MEMGVSKVESGGLFRLRHQSVEMDNARSRIDIDGPVTMWSHNRISGILAECRYLVPISRVLL